MKTLLLILFLVSVFVSSCGERPTTPPANIVALTNTPAPTPSTTFTPVPTKTRLPTQTPTASPTATPRAINKPGFITSLGTYQSSLDSSLVFSPDGSMLAQANKSVKIWDVSTHDLILELKYPYFRKYYATKAVFSPDGKWIAVSITNHLSQLGEPDGHLLVWDVSTGELQQDWQQESAIMSAYDGFQTEPRVYNIPVNAMVFFPNSTKLAYANGNRIEIRDVREGDESAGWSLGDAMYASEISTSSDGEFLYILMKWYKDLTFPSEYRWKFKAEIWHPATKSLRREIKLEEVKPLDADMWLVNQFLVYEDTNNAAIEVHDLSIDQRKNFPYRIGMKYFNSDASLMLVVRRNTSAEDCARVFL